MSRVLEPLASSTTFLEGDKYATSSSVIPFLLTIIEHLRDPEKKFACFKGECNKLISELKRRFEYILKPNIENFDCTYLVATFKVT